MCSVSDIQDYFQYILKKHREKTDNLSIEIYVNKMKNRITFKIKAGYSHQLLTSEITKLFGSNKSNIAKDKNGENVPHLEITQVVLVHCKFVNNDYQQDSRVLYTFIANKSFGQLLNIPIKYFVCLKIFYSEFLFIEVWFTGKSS